MELGTTTTHPCGIYAAMAKICKEVDAIGKDKQNIKQNFKFRGIDDVYNAIHNILAENKVFMLPKVLEDRTEDRTSSSGNALIYRILKIQFSFVHEDGSRVESVIIGEGMDSGDKASNKAMSIAHKYCILQAFCIPVKDMDDPDSDSPETAPKQQHGRQMHGPQGQQPQQHGRQMQRQQQPAPQGQPPQNGTQAPQGQQPQTQQGNGQPSQQGQQQPPPPSMTPNETAAHYLTSAFNVPLSDMEAAIGSPLAIWAPQDVDLLRKTVPHMKKGMSFADAIVEAQN